MATKEIKEKKETREKKEKGSIPQEGFQQSSSEKKKSEVIEEVKEDLEDKLDKPKKRRRRSKKKKPELTPEEQEILAALSPEGLTMPLRWIDGGIAKGTGIRPATDEEILNMSKAWSLVAQRRLPAWLIQYGDIVMAVGITMVSYGGRYLEKLSEEAKKKKEAEASGSDKKKPDNIHSG